MNDQASSQSLLEMHDRVLAVASLYDILARSDRSDTVCLQDYVTQIVESLKAAIGNSDISWQTKCAGDAPINGEQAFHLGLFLNEVVNNSIKHAFPSGKGRISVAVDASGEVVSLRVSDDGEGRPDELPEAGLGATIIESAVASLNGSLAVENGSGTAYVLNFLLKPHQHEAPRVP